MNNKEDIVNIEKELFEFFEEKRKNEDIPISTKNRINNAFKYQNKKKIKINIPQIAVWIFSIIILSTGIVFAKDIDTAVENGYVQNVEMKYVEDNNIGIKVDKILIDDTNLDISFIYNYKKEEKIKYIELYEYVLKDENNNIIYEFNKNKTNKEDISIVNQMMKDNDIKMIDINMFEESILYTSNQFPKFKEIVIEISKIKVTTENGEFINEGNWDINIKLNEEFTIENDKYYSIAPNKYLKNAVAELTETSLKINLTFNDIIDKNIIKEVESIVLKDIVEKEYRYKRFSCKDKTVYLEYDLSKYEKNIERLELNIKINKDNIIKINLYK